VVIKTKPMKKAILLILIFLFQLPGNTQVKLNRTRIDSLLRITRQKDLSDSVRVTAYYFLASYFKKRGFFDSALYYTYRGREEAQRVNYKYGQLESYQMEGSILTIKSQYKEALKSKLKALELAQEMKLEEEVISAYLSLGGYTI
jgi:hypothetical protein